MGTSRSRLCPLPPPDIRHPCAGRPTPASIAVARRFLRRIAALALVPKNTRPSPSGGRNCVRPSMRAIILAGGSGTRLHPGERDHIQAIAADL